MSCKPVFHLENSEVEIIQELSYEDMKLEPDLYSQSVLNFLVNLSLSIVIDCMLQKKCVFC